MDTNESLRERIEQLERVNRTHRRMRSVVGLAIVAVFAGGMIQADDGIQNVLRTRRLEIVNESGTSVLLGTATTAGDGVLVLSGNGGAQAISMSAGKSGGRFDLKDERAKNLFNAMATADGAQVTLRNKKEQVVISAVAAKAQGGSLSISSDAGAEGVRMSAGTEGGSVLTMNKRGGASVSLKSDTKDNGVVGIWDQSSKGRQLGPVDTPVAVASPKDPDEISRVVRTHRLEIVNPDGKAVLLGAASGDGNGILVVNGSSGAEALRISAQSSGGSLNLNNSNGKSVFGASATEDGGRLTIKNPKEQAVILATATKGQGGTFALTNDGGVEVVRADASKDGGSVSTNNKKGGVSVTLGADAKGGGQVGIWDEKGQGRQLGSKPE